MPSSLPMKTYTFRQWFVLFFSSGAFSGYLPKMPGTWGSILAALSLFYLPSLDLLPYIGLCVFVTLSGVWFCQQAGEIYGVVDDSKIVIDEIAGILITMIGIPLTANWLLWGFVAFRIFDIVKPPPARYFDRSVKNGWGVMFDDVAAAFYANLVLQLAAYITN